MGTREGATPLPVVAGYKISTLLGRGGFSSVYRAVQESVGRPVALKVLDASQVGADLERRFRSECRTVSSLSWHPHVVAVFDAGLADDGRPFMAMELFEGGSLADLIRRVGPMAPNEVTRVGLEMTDALSAAHQAGVIHRDVKPANILNGRRDDYVLSDFGIATITDTTQSATGSFLGTFAFSAPEVLRGERAGIRSDVFSLGVTLHTLLIGRSSFASGDATSPGAVVLRVLNDPVPPLPPDTPVALAAAIERATAKDPEDRFSTAAEFRDALGAADEEPASFAMAPPEPGPRDGAPVDVDETLVRAPPTTEPDGPPTVQRPSSGAAEENPSAQCLNTEWGAAREVVGLPQVPETPSSGPIAGPSERSDRRPLGIARWLRGELTLLSAVAIVIAAGLAVGILSLGSAPDQHTTLEPDFAYQERFGGPTRISLTTMAEGHTVEELFTTEGVASYERFDENLRDIEGVLGVITPLTALEFASALVSSRTGNFFESVAMQALQHALLVAEAASDEESTEIRDEDFVATMERLVSIPPDEYVLDNPEYVQFLLYDNEGEIRTALRPFFPDERRAVTIVRLTGDSTVGQQREALGAVASITDELPFVDDSLTEDGPFELSLHVEPDPGQSVFTDETVQATDDLVRQLFESWDNRLLARFGIVATVSDLMEVRGARPVPPTAELVTEAWERSPEDIRTLTATSDGAEFNVMILASTDAPELRSEIVHELRSDSYRPQGINVELYQHGRR